MKMGKKRGNESGMGTGRRTTPGRVFLSEKSHWCSIGHNPTHSIHVQRAESEKKSAGWGMSGEGGGYTRVAERLRLGFYK